MAVKMKPPFGVLVNRDHPLARGLIGAWLFNEPRGVGACDISRCHNLSAVGSPQRIALPSGGGLRFDGVDDYLTRPLPSGLSDSKPLSVVIRARNLASGNRGLLHIQGASGSATRILTIYMERENERVTAVHKGSSDYARYSANLGTQKWYQYAITLAGGNVRPTIYVDGEVYQVDAGGYYQPWDSNVFTIGAGLNYASSYNGNVEVDYVYLYNRVLSAAEVRRLSRDPFGFVGRGMRGWSAVLSLGEAVLHNASGTISAVSGAGGTATATAAAEIPRRKPWHQLGLQCRMSWHREAMFDAMTDGAWKLGTVLTQGWFWSRHSGCSVVYRECADPKSCTCGAAERWGDARYCVSTAGAAAEGLSAPMVLVVERDAPSIVVPAIWPHEPGSSCRYVVRRFNRSGEAERTAAAAVDVHIGADGELADPMPNGVVGLHVKYGRNILRPYLAWLYWPVAPAAPGAAFKVYWDHGTGEIDFVIPLAVVPCYGRKHYSYRCAPLEDGRYRFAVRPEAAAPAGGQAPCGPDAFVEAEIRTVAPSGITIYDL
jgi:hypothetical protein